MRKISTQKQGDKLTQINFGNTIGEKKRAGTQVKNPTQTLEVHRDKKLRKGGGREDTKGQ